MKRAKNKQTLQGVISGAVAFSLFCYQSRFPLLPRHDIACGQSTFL